jgi:hypothetical protein
MACEILYNRENIAKLRQAFTIYTKTENFDMFKSRFLRGVMPKEIRVTARYSDDLSDIQKLVVTFYEDLQKIAQNYQLQYPEKASLAIKLLSLVETEFHIDADNTQSASIESDVEIKTAQELADKYRGNLEAHLGEIYGLESFELLKSLEQDFYDMVIEAAYYNSHTGDSVNINPKVLNKNIYDLRQRLQNTIENYLEQNNIPFKKGNLLSVQAAFYQYLKSLTDLKEKLNNLQSEKIQGTEQQKKTKLFQNLVNLLESEPESKFHRNILPFLKRMKKLRLDYTLYSGDCYSSSYIAVRNYILKNRPDLVSKLAEIESTEANLLEATNAYSILVHFDTMLKDKLGKQISIQEGTEGIDIPNKYSYHQDTAHEIKGWQTSEDIGSEKHTSRFTQAVLSQIRIFDHKTDEFKNRRLDSTSFIVAARHLIDDILYGNIIFTGSAYAARLGDQIKENIRTLHSDPQTKFQKILELMFDVMAESQREPLINFTTNKKLLTDHDLDILYSVYLKVFNRNDATSFISQEMMGVSNNKLASGLMQEIAAYVDSNITMDYLETSVDWETGDIDLRVKKKYFNNAQLYKLRKSLNSDINGKSMQKRIELQGKDGVPGKYNFEIFESNPTTNFTVSFGGMNFTLEINNGTKAKILTAQDNRNPMKFLDTEIFNLLDKVDLIKFRQKRDLGATLTESEKALEQVLGFLDDYLGLNILSNLGLQTLQIYKSTYSEINGMKNYLMPLVQLAIRAAYVNHQYIKAGDLTLAESLKDDPIYKVYAENPKSKLFTSSFGNVKYVVASFNDKVLDAWVDSLSMLTGEASKATTKDGQGNAIPNNSVGKLGGILHYYLEKQKGTNCDSLMFVQNSEAIKSTFHDLEASNIHGDTKSIKQFSCGELFFHSIFNKFWGSYVKTGNVVIQPTVYSDKTTFLNWEIQTDLMNEPEYVSKVVKKYMETLGYFYENVYNDTMDKLNLIADAYNSDRSNTDITYVPLSTKEVLKNLTEQQLLTYGKRLGIDLEKDKDYRERKKKVVIDGKEKTIKYCVVNEILEYNARVYNDETLLYEALNHEKYNFLQNLIDYNSAFQVIDFGDDIEYYLKDKIDDRAKSKNAVITTILNYYKSPDDRKAFFSEWIDAKTGKMILAKQGDRNILGLSGDFNKNEEGMILNPLLDKFFYIEGLLSNNLRMSLTGSEINHPDKAFGTLLNTIKDPKKVSDFVTFNKVTGEQLKNKEEYEALKSIIDQCDTVSEIREQALLHANTPVGSILHRIYEKSIIKIINTAQGTQFKRNVIIPATLQYCQQGTRVGITSKIKGAVIYDEEAPVHNYRGETGTVDSADGSAQINPFQSILENLSLGSQAVGFIKKPIWHSYDTNGGTAFLAKFATNTITNEAMKASMHSKTNLYKLFKRMTNMQWPEVIDLTKPIHKTRIYDDQDIIEQADRSTWVREVLFEGSKLFYENKYGQRVEIKDFNKTVTTDGSIYYYTSEKIGAGNLAQESKVYHIFYDSVNPETGQIIEQSIHKTFNTWQQVEAFKKENLNNPQIANIHTINSLFELHTALGGVSCVDSQGNNSEFNNKVVVNFMNNIGTRREGVPANAIVNQENYYQPLKEYHIGYAFNNTAVKNGAKNINKAEAWSGDVELNYFEIDSDGLGMQMNADHDIVNSELTEFSQVIAATSAYGYTYDNCNEIFKGLAKTAMQASRRVLESVDKFLENVGPEAQSELYDAIGRIVLMERSIKDRESLTGIISEAVLKIFNKNKNHSDDDIKIPFSDSNIYSEFISGLASAITKASIKRKHPGSGCVMAPGYNMITYFEIGDQKYTHKDILKKARTNFISELREVVKQSPKYNPETKTINDNALSDLSLQDLLEMPEVIAYLNSEDINAGYILNLPDAVMFNKALVDRYLDTLQKEAPTYDKEYFQPEDVVRIITPAGVVEQTIVLDSMEKYYAFKDRIDLPGTIYQVDVKTPRNLKPSLIRWQYIDNNGQKRFMNVFDHPVIKNAFLEKEGKLDADYRKQVQDILHNLHAGFFVMDGIRYELVPNSLENTEAELVMSNIYKEIFGVESESLQEILEQGEQFFIDQIDHKLHAPVNKIYDVALLKDNGKHTLIKFGNVVPNDYCVENEFKDISVNDKDEIYCMKQNRPLFKIGKFVNVSGEELDDLYLDSGRIISKSGKDVDEKQYRIKGNIIQKRIDFVKRFKLTSKSINKKTNQEYYTTNTLYQIIRKDDLVKLYGNEADAHKQIGSLLTDIYSQDNYKFIELNPLNGEKYLNQINTIRGYFGWFMENRYVHPEHKQFIQAQLDSFDGSIKTNKANLAALKKDFYQREAHKKWVSFQDSLKFIASRIPAQTLQSFMTMKCVGWTENTKNMAYVSHFQIYLQGSDYDIDKAYIMGQSYDGNGNYIQWSPLFDFTSVETLAISKQLPTPEKVTLRKSEDGIDVTAELEVILKNSDNNLQPTSYEARVENLKAFVALIKKINKANGAITYRVPDSPKMDKVIDILNQHIHYVIPENVAEAAYKNVASANIYAVSHDVRNRDQGYTAITMKTLQDAAKDSPKGEQAARLNMLNPLTKYVMQYQNIVGKNVISIAANGEKVWFNAYYYWTKLLKEGKASRLQFNTNLKRVAGRAKLSNKELNQLSKEGKTTNILPDLNPYDKEIKNALLNEFGVILDDAEYAYVDQLISQLLSAATDNAKELILAKINAGSNFARMYVYLIMTGYNFDDIVSFMISPASEFIDSMSNSNMFQDSDLKNSPNQAINLAMGKIKSYSFLHGSVSEWDIDETTGDKIEVKTKKSDFVKRALESHSLYNDISDKIRVKENLTEDDLIDLDTLMQGFVLESLNNPNLDLTEILESKDMEINTYLQYCQNIVYKLRNVSSKYSSISEMLADAEEFKKIYDLSTEISGIASAWLGLNQGLPTDELGLLKRFDSMAKVILNREKSLGINPDQMFTDSEDINKIDKARRYLEKVINRIVDNNSMLSRDTVEQALRTAHAKGLMKTFDVYRYLTDKQYREDMINYNHIIKGTLNVLDMMEEIPHYKEIINCLKALAVSKQTLSSKSRLINKLIQEANIEYLSDQQLRGIIRYVDKLNAVNFAKNLGKIIVLDKSIEGFNSYFSDILTDKFDLSTFEGIATFKHWVEHEFLDDLKDNYSNNPLVAHLQKVPENQRDILATDIDLLNPNVTTATRQGYDEILRGMAMFEKVANYKGTGFSIADILQLYNILVNTNQYGAERLTTTFKACSNKDSILNTYLSFIGEQDYDFNTLQDYEMIDYYINAAPIVSTGAERFRTDKFIKVNDPVEGYIIKQYNANSNEYEVYQLIPAKDGHESTENRLRRLQNFAEFCPFEMPMMAKITEMFSAINFDGEVTDDILDRIKKILIDFSSSGKLIVYKDC